MKNSSVQCRPRDYDFYTIPFPLSAIKKEQRNKYIYSELGKLHPCFSDDCCFDARLRLEKTGFKADVVVMQKYTLAEYKTKSRKIFIEERKRIPFFCSNEKRKQYLLVLFFLALCPGIFLFLNRQKSVEADNRQNISVEKEVLQTESKADVLEDEACDTALFLGRLAELNGRITNFEWKTDGFSSQLSAEIKGVYPEQLSPDFKDAVFSSVTFEDGMPVMKINLVQKTKTGIGNKGNTAGFEQTQLWDFRADLRSLVQKLCGKITEETVTPFGIKFCIPCESKAFCSEVFLQIFEFLSDSELCIKSIRISSKNDGMDVNLCFSEILLNYSKAVCESLVLNRELFVPETTSGKKSELVQKALPGAKNDNAGSWTKVGQVIREDGTFVNFYKDKNGKLIREEGGNRL